MIDQERLENGEITNEEQALFQHALARKQSFDEIRGHAFTDIRILESCYGFKELPDGYVFVQFTCDGKTIQTSAPHELARKLGLVGAYEERSNADRFVSYLHSLEVALDPSILSREVRTIVGELIAKERAESEPQKFATYVDEFASRLRTITLTVEQANRLHRAIDGRTRPQPENVTQGVVQRKESSDCTTTGRAEVANAPQETRGSYEVNVVVRANEKADLRKISQEVARKVADAITGASAA